MFSSHDTDKAFQMLAVHLYISSLGMNYGRPPHQHQAEAKGQALRDALKFMEDSDTIFSARKALER